MENNNDSNKVLSKLVTELTIVKAQHLAYCEALNTILLSGLDELGRKEFQKNVDELTDKHLRQIRSEWVN